jgi:hypothetical protein
MIDECEALEQECKSLRAALEVAIRQRNSAEDRGHRWLKDVMRADDEVRACIEHIESEIRLGRGNAAHHRILARLHTLHETML